MNSTLYPICALVAWIVVVANIRRLPQLRREPSRLATWFMFVFFALIFTSSWPAVYDRLDDWTGLACSCYLIAQLFVIGFSASAAILLQLWTSEPSQAATRTVVTALAGALTAATMIVLFLFSDGEHRRDPTYLGWYGGRGTQVGYLGLYLSAFTFADVAIVILCFRYGRLMTRSWMRTGLITAGVGAAFGTVYCITRVFDIINAHLGYNPQRWEGFAQAGAGGGALLVMLGLTMHQWGPALRRTAIRLHHAAMFLRLRPLWVALYRRDPGIALDVPGRRSLAAGLIRDPDYHLTRRVIEIRDGILALHPYLDPADADHLRDLLHDRHPDLRGRDLDAAVEAARIQAALQSDSRSPKTSSRGWVQLNNTPGDLNAEVAWLSLVASHFARTRPSSNPVNPSPIGANQ